jgi:23S rRNA pseudouridine1911/1915/1917 synthase
MMPDEKEILNFNVAPEMDRERADKVLHAIMPDLSRSRVQRLFDLGMVWREDEALVKSDKMYAGDVVSYEIPEVVPAKLRPVDIPLRVLYEDADMIAIDKAPGMVVHPGAGTGEDTLVHALLFHCKGQLSGIGGEERPGIVHRLDKETSGVIVAAKTDQAFLALTKTFSERRTKKEYLAIVAGSPNLPGGEIDAPIGRHGFNRLRMCVRNDGRPAQSDWEIVERFGKAATLVKVRIHTGRTHQVRVHMSHIGYPLAGDPMYGWRENAWPESVPVPRVMLHAWRLSLPHPISGETLELEAPIPDDFSSVLDHLRTAAASERASRL